MPMVRVGVEWRAKVWQVLTEAPELTRFVMKTTRSEWKSADPSDVFYGTPAAFRSCWSIRAV
jgi:hypothetical protein